MFIYKQDKNTDSDFWDNMDTFVLSIVMGQQIIGSGDNYRDRILNYISSTGEYAVVQLPLF